MSKNASNRRRTLVVNKPLQKQLIMTMSALPAIGLCIAMVLVCTFCFNLWGEVVRLQVQLDSLLPLFLSVSAFIMLSGGFLLYSALRISHQIAGPLHRICRSIERVREGDVAFDVNLREGDYFQEVAKELNLLIDKLNENPPDDFVTRESHASTGAEHTEEASAQDEGSEQPALAGASEQS